MNYSLQSHPLDAEQVDLSNDGEPGSAVFPLIRASDMKFRLPDYLVNGLLEMGNTAMVFGDPGVGKSFFALDIAASVATGARFHTREVIQGPVIFIAGEGLNGLKRRTLAWEKHNGRSLDDAPLYFSKHAADFLDQRIAQSVADNVTRVAAKEGPPKLIVIDTLARNFGSGDENQTKDMNAFIAAIDMLKANFIDCTVLIVHHTGHSDKQRARGNMALKAALDAEYRIKKSGRSITLTNTKMKDAEPPSQISFELQTIEIGQTAEGNAVSSAFLADAGLSPRSPSQTVSPANRLALESFDMARKAAELGGNCSGWMHVDVWRPEFYKMHTAEKKAAKKMAFQRARKALVELNELQERGNEYRRFPKTEVSA